MENSIRNGKNTQYFIAAIAILALLSAGLGYLYLQEKKFNEQKQSKIDAQIKEQVMATAKIDSMSREISIKIVEVTKLGGDITSLQAIKIDLEKDKKLILTQKSVNIKTFEAKIKNYELLLVEKDVDLQKLREENGILTNKNETLNSENTVLKSDKSRLADSVSLVTARNKELSDKVTLAAALHAETINVYAISARGKETEGGSYKARKLDKVRISFHLADNLLTRQEEKEIIMRILDPAGTIISDMATGSGVFVYNGQETIFTSKKRELFTNTHQLVEFVYARGQDYKQGKYNIELYAEGYKIGVGSFEVK
jgi:hypothetical protein